VNDATNGRAIPPLPETTILLVKVGSTAHGTGLPGGEDHDELGIVVESPTEVLGLGDCGFRTVMQRTQPEGARSGPGDTDRTLYSLRRFLQLAVAGNPSVMMTFWAPVLDATETGIELRALGEACVGRHVIPRYRGYMQSQANRVLGLRGSGQGQRGWGEREQRIATHGYETKFAMHCARLGLQGIELLTTRRLALPIEGEAADWLRAVRRGEIAFDEWWGRVLDLDAELEDLAADESIPAAPEHERIESWSVRTHVQSWSVTP
jgi:hypothetical protein